MPIYEFYCRRCHRIFSFLSRTPNTRKRPSCPKCGRAGLQRKPSAFAISRGLERPGDDPLSGLDEERLEKAMEALSGEFDGVDENDPRQAARLMRQLYEATGIEPGPNVDEAVRRMEAGEDPDRIEEDLGDLLEEEDPLAGGEGKRMRRLYRRYLPPSVDDTLHEL